MILRIYKGIKDLTSAAGVRSLKMFVLECLWAVFYLKRTVYCIILNIFFWWSTTNLTYFCSCQLQKRIAAWLVSKTFALHIAHVSSLIKATIMPYASTQKPQAA